MSFNQQFSGNRPNIRFGPPLSRVIKIFVIACAAVFGVQFLVQTFFGDKALYQIILFFGLVPERVIHGFVWQLITFNFLHANLTHLFFNMFAIWMFGSDLERTLGPRRTVAFFIVTGIGAGLLNLAVMPLMNRAEWGVPSIGASGIAYGILFAFGYLWPKRKILLMLVFPIEARWLVIIYGSVELLYSIRMVSDQGHDQVGTRVGHIAHVGGMLFAFLYLRYGVLYHRLREKYYRRKLDKLKQRYTVIDGGKDEQSPTIH